MTMNRRPPSKGPERPRTPTVSPDDERLFLECVTLLGLPDETKAPAGRKPPPQKRDLRDAAPGTAPRGAFTSNERKTGPACTTEDAALFEAAFLSLGGTSARPPEIAAPVPAPTLASTPAPSGNPLKSHAIKVIADLDMASLASEIDGDERIPTGQLAPERPVVRGSLPGLPNEKQFRAALEKRRLVVGSTLDLHGFTADRATDLLRSFMRESVAADLRVVLVIHGKGLHSPSDPVLRDLVRRLLRDDLAGFVRLVTTAPANLGGTGATAVLLRLAEPTTEPAATA